MQLFGGKKKPKHSANAQKSSGADSGAQYSAAPQGSPEEFTQMQEKAAGRRWLKGVLIALLVIVLLVAGVYAGIQIWSTAPDISTGGLTEHTPQPGTDPEVEQTDTPIAEGEEPEQAVTSGRRDGTYTFAIIGTDVVSNSTDTILVGMLDTVEGKLNIVSIPRDTLVNTGYDRKKINYIYPANVNSGRDGLQPLLDTLRDMMGFEIDSYALVDVEVCAQLVDAIGGVWFDVPVDMDWDAWDQNLYIHIKAGYQKLSGEDAVKVMRFRYSNDGSNTYAGGDIDRINVQHDLLMAIAKQVLTIGNISKLGTLFDIYENGVTTNVTTGNLVFYAQEFLKLGAEDITMATLPANYYGSLYTVGYCFPYIDQWLTMLNEMLNPFESEITRANIDMLYSDGLTVGGTQGYIRGGIESFYGDTP